MLKGKIKETNNEFSKISSELKAANKALKTKDKEIYQLENKGENQLATIKRIKEDLNHSKSEKCKADKEIKKLTKKLENVENNENKKQQAYSENSKVSSVESGPVLTPKPIITSVDSLSLSQSTTNATCMLSSLPSTPASSTLEKTEENYSNDATTYNIETNNNFELVGDKMIKASKVVDTQQNVVDIKITKISKHNYTEAFEGFLTNYKDDLTDTPKYPGVAAHMMEKKS